MATREITVTTSPQRLMLPEGETYSLQARPAPPGLYVFHADVTGTTAPARDAPAEALIPGRIYEVAVESGESKWLWTNSGEVDVSYNTTPG